MRGLLDRHFGQVNSYFIKAFSVEKAPLQTSVDRLRSIGSVALLDVGGGTGHGSRTWVAAVRRYATSLDQVSATCLSLHDYSNQSLSPATRRAIQEGEIHYIVGDAEDMVKVPNRSADIIVASTSVGHMDNPHLALHEMVRVTCPGGVIYLDVKEDLYLPDLPISKAIFGLEGAGYQVETRVDMVDDPMEGRHSWHTTFIRIEKPDTTI